MTPFELLARLEELDVHVAAEGGKLRLNAPEGVLTPELRDMLAQRKREVLAFLSAREVASAPHPSIVPLRKDGTRTPFFAVPGHNGDVFCYVHLLQRLRADQPFYALQPPGLDGRRRPLHDLVALAALYADELCDFRPEGSFVVGGYCLGGTIAFETARQLVARGRTVSLLVLFGSPCPTSLRPWARAVTALHELRDKARNQVGALRSRAPREWPRYLASRLRSRAEGEPNELPEAVAAYRLAVEEATVAAARRYRPQPFSGPIALLLPSESWRHSDDRPMDWRRFAAGGFETITGPPDGNGDRMLREPQVAWVAERLVPLLAVAAPCGQAAAGTA